MAQGRLMPLLNNLRILIADDHDIVRKGLKTLVASRSGWVICAEAGTGRDAVALAVKHRPDIVIMDLSMPELNGLEATRKIRKMLPQTQVVILSVHYSDQLVREVVDAGARAYVLKSDASSELVIAIEALANNRPFFTSGATQVLLDGFPRPLSDEPQAPLMYKPLTARQREVVQLLAEGKSSKEVALVLAISVKTAETHRINIMRRLGMRSVSQLVRYAVKNYIIEP